MAHSHGTPSLAEIEMPEGIGETTAFWFNETQYTLKRDREDMWMLFGHFRRGSATPLVTLNPKGDKWELMEVNGRDGKTLVFDDWRAALRTSL